MNFLWLLNLVMAFVSFCTFIWGVRAVFRKVSERNPRGMSVIKSVAGAVMLTLLASICFAPSSGATMQWAGIFCFLLSNVMFWSAARENRKKPLSLAYSEDLPVHVVKTGIYSWVRHPFYTSYLVAYLGSVFAAPTTITFLCFGIMAVLYTHAARTEEKKFQRSDLRNAYRDYASRTGMFLPKVAKRTENRPAA